MEVMSPLVPRSRDQKRSKSKRKTKQKQCIVFFPDEMRSDLPICCCFRLIYIITDRKIVCFSGGLGP